VDNKHNEEDQYWDAVDEFISLANKRSEISNLGIVVSAMTQAAARFSAFYAASSSESRKDLKEDKDQLVGDFSREFKKRFAENLEDYIENYKVYLPPIDEGND